MIHNVLRTLGGIDHYGVLSLCIFGFIFAAVLVWTFLQRKTHLDHMSQLPLEPDPTDLISGKERHE